MGNAICGDGMCPYVPCKDFPKCSHERKMKKYKRFGIDRLEGKIPKEMDELEFKNSLVLNKSFEEKSWFGIKGIPIITKIVWYKEK